jgi:hypothetical protein
MSNSHDCAKGQAYHEAGHVVFGFLARKRLRSVEIRHGDHQDGGRAEWDATLPRTGPLQLDQIKPECLILLAGHEVEQWFYPPPADQSYAHSSDWAQVTERFNRVSNTSEQEYKSKWIAEIRDTLQREDVRRAIESVAKRLLESSSLSAEEAITLVRAHLGDKR